MNPQEIAWLEDHQRLVTRLAAARQVVAAWEAHHGRVQEELAEASRQAEELEDLLAKHDKARPEPDEEEEP